MMYQEELNDIQNITQILVSVEKIHSTLQEILILSGKLTKKYPKVIVMIHTFTQDIGNTVLKTLLNLWFDLQIRLTEQQKNLEWAKSEIEANIQWTTELNQVSELQKARLDRQIEQFEELRRVLVKV